MATLLDHALCTVDDVKESLGIASSDNTRNNLIIRKINQATEAIERYCGRRFAATLYENVEYSGTDVDTIVLRQRPIIDLTMFGYRDSTLNEGSWDEFESELYFVDEAAGVINLNFRAWGSWNRYRVTYSAGYVNIPADLAESCAELACHYISSGGATNVGVARKKEGQREIQYSTNKQTFTSILESLGIDGVIASYANYPLATGD